MVQLAQILGMELVPGTTREIECLEARLLKLPQVHYKLRTFHAPGIYLREIFMPRGALIVGHEHLTEHFNIVAQGAALVVIGGRVERMVAPYAVTSAAGVRKVLLILEDMVWYTVHANPTNEKDEAELESLLIVKSPTFLSHHEQLEAEQTLARLGHLLPDFSKPQPALNA